MKKLKYTEEEINNYDFFQSWQTDNKDWVKERRKQWPAIKRKLDQINKYIGLDKKYYKDYKSYFMTGYIHPVTEENIDVWGYNYQPICLKTHDTGALFSFWLSPDHSVENLQRILCARAYDAVRRNHDKNSWYIRTCKFFRRTVSCYVQIESYFLKSGPERRLTPEYNCEPIFDGLESLLSVHLPAIWLGANLYHEVYYSIHYSGHIDLGGEYSHYLEGSRFSPSNPIRYFVEEYLKAQFITDEFYITKGGNVRSRLIAIVWHIVAFPDEFHPIQVEVAQKLKLGIMKLYDDFPPAMVDFFDRGVAMYEKGLSVSLREEYPNEFEDGYGGYYEFKKDKLGYPF